MAKKKRWGKKFKDKRNWKEYNEKLVKRGEFYINPRFLETWLTEIKEMNCRKIGQPYMYPNSLIEFLTILHSKGFDYRSLNGIMGSLSKRLGPFPVISFSQIRRRMLTMDINFKAKSDDLVVAVDGTGLKVNNRGDWIREKWKLRRGWLKVVIMGDKAGNIIDIRSGNEQLDENASGRSMLRTNYRKIKKYMGDGLHYTKANFNLLDHLGIEPVIKIRKDASGSGVSPKAKAVQEYEKKGYKKWAKEKGYGFRWPASEGIFSATKRMFGESVSSHKKRNMYCEAKLKFWAYQQLKDIV